MEKINLSKFIIENYATLLEALKKLEENKKRFLLVQLESGTICGTITDGDIRRAIIQNSNLNEPVKSFLNKNFSHLCIESDFSEVCEKFREDKVEFLPVLDKQGKLLNILTKKQFHILLLENKDFNLSYDFQELDKTILEHEIYNRPWGFFKSTVLTNHAQAKIITLFPKSEISLQEHKLREEHWVIIKGEGEVILGESKISIYPGKYIYIPKGCKHQIINTSDKNIIFSEVQLGDYFGEDDIIRYSDKYGRV